MLIPVNTKVRKDLAISVVRQSNGEYSAAVVSITNMGLDSIPSHEYYTRERDEEFDPVVWYEGELGKSVDENPLKAIEKCLNQIYQQQL